MKKQNKKLKIRITAVISLILLAGCSTPQERCGVSPIPFNSPEPDESMTFDGSF